MRRAPGAGRRLHAAVAIVGLGVAVTLAACGGDDGATAATAEPTDPSGSTQMDGAFPVTVEHTYGSTTVPEEPARVVSIGFTDQDLLLALGVHPVAVREWYGEQPYATWPWAQDELGGARPQVLPSTELNFEQIAALDPDLIVGVSSGMTDTEYATLAQIAPTIAQPAGYIAFGAPWDVALRQIGAAVGRAGTAADVEAATRVRFEAVRAAHPEFEGKSAGVAFLFEEEPGAYASGDPRSQFLADLGFEIPEEYDDLAGEQFYFSLSQEELARLDTDVIVWLGTDQATVEAIASMPLRPNTRASSEGREVLADALLTGAFSFSSPLSIEYALDRLVPELALAVDGDPDTAVPSAAALASGAT